MSYPGFATKQLDTRVVSVVLDENGADVPNTECECTFYEATIVARVPHTQAAELFAKLANGTVYTEYNGVRSAISLIH